MNVKRLRPIELGPFDYEHAPVTTGLWVGEGLTSYFGDLLAERSGLGSPADYLNLESRHIRDLQVNQPGRLVQTLEQSSSQMFERLPADKKVDYYVKGPVAGLVLDAHIRHRTNGKKSMDDVMRLEYRRWSGAHGYSAAQFNQTMSDAAGVDISPLLHRLIATTDEIDYTEMLDWFGLRSERGPVQGLDARSAAGRDRGTEGAFRRVPGAFEAVMRRERVSAPGPPRVGRDSQAAPA
jgi:predicted metalloprotease with PDZ domain